MKSFSKKLFYFLGLAVIVSLFMVGCASTTDYMVYEGSKTFRGKGGAKRMVDGMEVWMHGTPPRKYKIVGMIDTSSGVQSAVREAWKRGADALILEDSDTRYTGSISLGNSYFHGHRHGGWGFGIGESIPTYRTDYLYAAIKYVK